MSGNQNKARLSKAILDMKFMKKSKERVEKEDEDAEGQAMYSNDITDQMRKGEKFIIVEASIATCKNLIDGRLSFKGFNPEIERLMAKEQEKYTRTVVEKEADVSELEMARRLQPKDPNKRSKRRILIRPTEED